MVDLSISIANTNNRDLLDKCLASIFASTSRISLEVFVTDNCSTDGSAEMVRQKYPNVNLIINQTRKGYSANINQGIRQARGRYVLISNEDIVFYPAALDRMVAFMDAHPAAGAIGPKIIGGNGMFLANGRESMSLTYWLRGLLGPEQPSMGASLLKGRDYGQVAEVVCLVGCCMMVRKSVLDRVGLMDEQFFMYFEDDDLCMRIVKDGWKNYYVPDAEIVHYGGQANIQFGDAMGIISMHSICRFYAKHRGRVYAAICWLFIMVISMAKIVYFSLQFLLARQKERRKCYGHKVTLHGQVIASMWQGMTADDRPPTARVGDRQPDVWTSCE
jgi:GT2 family glycosyltransferase